MDKEKSLDNSSKSSRSEVDKLIQKVRSALESSRDCIDESSERIAQTTMKAAENVDDYVHKKPWQSMSIGIALGILLGILISRR